MRQCAYKLNRARDACCCVVYALYFSVYMMYGVLFTQLECRCEQYKYTHSAQHRTRTLHIFLIAFASACVCVYECAHKDRGSLSRWCECAAAAAAPQGVPISAVTKRYAGFGTQKHNAAHNGATPAIYGGFANCQTAKRNGGTHRHRAERPN